MTVLQAVFLLAGNETSDSENPQILYPPFLYRQNHVGQNYGISWER